MKVISVEGGITIIVLQSFSPVFKWLRAPLEPFGSEAGADGRLPTAYVAVDYNGE